MKYDINGDGVVDPSAGDRVLLYFTTGRNSGLSRYYALDVTDKASPQFLWSIDSTQLPGLGQAWSSPTVARVTVAGATQNGQHLVLIFGGGYDPVEDNYSFVNSDTRRQSSLHGRCEDRRAAVVRWTGHHLQLPPLAHDARDPEPDHGGRRQR